MSAADKAVDLDATGKTIDLMEALKTSLKGDPQYAARAAIRQVIETGARLGRAVMNVQALEDTRPLVKARCIEAMLGSPNPLGKPGAVHSASSAEAVVEQHQDYWQHRAQQAAAEVERHSAIAAFEAAKLTARLELTLVESRAE